ncbi:MAG: hypothetical protein ABL930_08760 [Pseudobdellovibrio sp.]
MLKNLNRGLLSALVATQLLFVGALYTPQAEAATRCSMRTLLEQSSRAEFESGFNLMNLAGVDKVKLTASTVANLKKAFEKEGIELKSNKIKTVLETAARSFKGDSITGSISQSNKMAELGRKILEIVKPDLKGDQVKKVSYMIAESVLRLENFTISEFATDRETAAFSKKSAVHIDKFHDLVESYIDGTASYRDLPNDAGLLAWPEIRGLYSNNSWIIGIRHHDMYHLHYSYGHPYYLAVNLMVSRSVNDRRYMMISSLWESVDSFKASYERAIAYHLKDKGMTAEEGMVYLAGATEKELDAIDAAIGGVDQVNSSRELSFGQGWRPTRTKFGRGNLEYNDATFLSEINNYINESLKRMDKEGSERYVNYHRRGPGVTVEVSEDSIVRNN